MARARAIEQTVPRRLAACATRGTLTRCGCRGRREVAWHWCGRHLLCTRCQRRRARRLKMRMRDGLLAAARAAPRWHQWTLITLTLQHSGDIARDRADLAAGWRRFYRALWKRGWGRFPYVGVWEVTPGRDGKGHVHIHVAALWPFRDWHVCSALWRRACPRSARISFVRRRRDGRPSSPESVANYLAKYVSKGVQTEDFTPQLRSRIVAGTYNTRWVMTSRGFWQVFTPICRDCGDQRMSAEFRWHVAVAWCPWSAAPGGTDPPRAGPMVQLEIPATVERPGARGP